MDSTRRTLLTTGVAAAAAAAAPRAFTQAAGKADTARPSYQRGDVRIHYAEAGSGFPFLIERTVQRNRGVQERVSLYYG